MARTVKDQSRGCFGWFIVLFFLLVAGIVFHRFVIRKSAAPELVELNARRMSQISRDYYQFHVEKNRYPESMEELRLFRENDPRTYTDAWGNPFRMMEKDGAVYAYSIGPDEQDDGGKIIYDPTNGLDTSGDRVYLLRRSEE